MTWKTVLRYATGVALIVIGFVIVLADVDVVYRTGQEVHKVNQAIGLGLATIGAYVLDPTWVVNLATKVAAYLPGHQNPPVPPST